MTYNNALMGTLNPGLTHTHLWYGCSARQTGTSYAGWCTRFACLTRWRRVVAGRSRSSSTAANIPDTASAATSSSSAETSAVPAAAKAPKYGADLHFKIIVVILLFSNGQYAHFVLIRSTLYFCSLINDNIAKWSWKYGGSLQFLIHTNCVSLKSICASLNVKLCIFKNHFTQPITNGMV